MNILISSLDRKSFYFRSDSTMIRKLDCYYIPDYVESIKAVPVLCFRLDRAGKSIPEKFADRFIGPVSCGIMLCAELKDRNLIHREFIENNLDYTTIIPYDLHPKEDFVNSISEDSPLELRFNGILKHRITCMPDLREVESVFSDISRFCSVRTGDFLALELSEGFEITPDSHVVMTFAQSEQVDFIVK